MNLSEAINSFRTIDEAALKQVFVTKFSDGSYVQTADNPRVKRGEPFVLGFRSKGGIWTDPQTSKTKAEAKKKHDALVKKLAKRHGGKTQDTSDSNWVSKMMGTSPKRKFGPQ